MTETARHQGRGPCEGCECDRCSHGFRGCEAASHPAGREATPDDAYCFHCGKRLADPDESHDDHVTAGREATGRCLGCCHPSGSTCGGCGAFVNDGWDGKTAGREATPEHLWVDFDFPREDGSVTQFCPRCGENREQPPPARETPCACAHCHNIPAPGRTHCTVCRIGCAP